MRYKRPLLLIALFLSGAAQGDDIAFSSATYGGAENDGSVSLTVSRTGSGVGGASVDFTTGDGSATSGNDYLLTSGTLTWSDGDTTDKTISVSLQDDSDVEGSENFTVTLSNPAGATIGAIASTTVTLSDVEPGRLEFSGGYEALESAGSATITIGRLSGTTGAASVAYATSDGNAVAGIDYVAASGTLSWNDGEGGEKSFTVPLTNDDDVEGDETVTLILSNPTGATLGTTTSMTLIIRDDDVAIRFSSATTGAAEADGWIYVEAVRIGGTAGAVSAQYAVTEGSATAESDYLAASGSISWESGDTTPKFIAIELVDDAVAEANETLTLTLSTPSGASLREPFVATLTINNDDTDFSAPLTRIAPSVEGVNQPQVIDLSEESPLDDTTSMLELVNELDVASSGRFDFSQDTTSGVLSTPFAGSSVLFAHPVRIETPQQGRAPGLYLSDSAELRIVTGGGIEVVALPASADLTALYDAVTDIGLAEVVVTSHGDLSIPANAGSAPLVPDEDGELIIPPEWFLRFVTRPAFHDNPADDDTEEGIIPRPHPSVAGLHLIVHRFTRENEPREQLLYPALADWDEILDVLRQDDRFERFIQGTDGVLRLEMEGLDLTLLPDYRIERADPPASGQTEFHPQGDLNGDGTDDFVIVYRNGDRQRLYLLIDE